MSGCQTALFCKSYRKDLGRCQRLHESVLALVGSEIAFVLCVPAEDRALFEAKLSRERLTLHTDEQVLGNSRSQSWKGQQVVKLLAHRLGFADVWLVVDSDFYFIRSFTSDDFRGARGRFRFVVSRYRHAYEPEYHEVLAQLHGGRAIEALTREECREFRAPGGSIGTLSNWQVLQDRVSDMFMARDPYARLARIPAVMNRPGPYLNYMPGPIWSRAILERFEQEFLAPRRITQDALIRYAPWESVWIGEWVTAVGFEALAGEFEMEPSESLFLHFQSDTAIGQARAAGLTEAGLARSYYGLALASGQQQIERY